MTVERKKEKKNGKRKRSMRLYFRANPSELYHTCYHDPFMRGERDHLTDDYLQPRYCDTHLQVLLMNPTMSSSPIIFLLIPITVISFNRISQNFTENSTNLCNFIYNSTIFLNHFLNQNHFIQNITIFNFEIRS